MEARGRDIKEDIVAFPSLAHPQERQGTRVQVIFFNIRRSTIFSEKKKDQRRYDNNHSLLPPCPLVESTSPRRANPRQASGRSSGACGGSSEAGFYKFAIKRPFTPFSISKKECVRNPNSSIPQEVGFRHPATPPKRGGGSEKLEV